MNGDHFWQKFAEFILLALTVLFVLMAYWATWANHVDFAGAMLDNNKLVLGALLGLLTKQLLTRSGDNGNGGGNNGKTTVNNNNGNQPNGGGDVTVGLSQTGDSTNTGRYQHL